MPEQDFLTRFNQDPASAVVEFAMSERKRREAEAAAQQEAMIVQQALQQKQLEQRQREFQQKQEQLPDVNPDQYQFGFDKYEAQQYMLKKQLEAQRQAILDQADQLMMSGNNKGADYLIETRLKPLDKQAAAIKPFTSTEDFNVVKEFVNSDDFKKKKDSVNMLYNSIKSVDETARTDPQFATSLARTFLTTLVNSAKGTSDAEQDNEFSRRAPELQAFREWTRSRNMSPMNPLAIREFLDQRNANHPAYKAVIDKFAANPQAYIAKTKIIHDDLAKAYSDTALQRVVLPTSPEFAEKKLGVYRPKFFAEEDAKEAKKADEFAAIQRMKALDQDPRVGKIKELISNPNLSPEVRKKAQDALGAIENSMFGVQIKGGDMR